MKRFLAGLMALLLLMGSALAEDYAPSNAAIMVDGVRTAFFSPEGMYLQPVEKDGLIYVPVDALGETLGIAVTSDADTQAVTVNGIRVAFFDAAGMYLPPLVINGLVYVPLVAFAESAGVDLAQEGNTYAFSRQAAQPAAQQAAAAPAPAPAATAVPMYGYVPVTEVNFLDFFTVETGSSHQDIDYKRSSFTVTNTLTCRAITSYGLENVSFTVNDFGTIQVPASGYVSKKIQETIYRYQYNSDTDYIWGQTNTAMKATLNSYSLQRASGKLRMSYQEAESLLAGYYEKAEAYAGLGGYNNAIRYYELLMKADYKDSREKLKEVENQKLAAAKAEAERKAKAQEEENQKKYNEAQALLDEGNFDEAEKAFAALKNFKDSAAKVEEVKTARQEAQYQEAMQALQAENWDEAVKLFKALNGYKDSADREEEAKAARLNARYQEALSVLQAEDWEKAFKLFNDLGGYKDSAARAEEAREGQRSARYYQAMNYALENQYDQAIEIFQSLGDYKDSPQQLKNCQTAKLQAAYTAAEELERQGKSVEAYNAFAALGDYQDSAQRAAELKYYSAMNEARTMMAKGNYKKAMSAAAPYAGTDSEAYQIHRQATFRENGMAQPMSADGTGWVKVSGGYTLMDLKGKAIAHVNYTNPGPWRDGYTLFKKSNGRYVYLDTQGREAFGMEFKEAEDFNQGGALVTLTDGTKAVATDDGVVFKLPEKKGRVYKSYVGEDMISFVEKEKWGLVNLTGKVVTKAKYTHGIDRFKNGMAKAYQKKNGEYYVPVPALINAKGKEGVKIFTYNDVIALGNNLIAGKNMNTDNYRIMNLKGKTHKNSRKGGYKNVDGQGNVILVQMDNKKWQALDLDLKPITTTESTAEIQVGAGGKALLFTKGGSMELFFTVPQSKMTVGKGSVKMSVDSPYVVVKNGTKGWCIYDGNGNLIF